MTKKDVLARVQHWIDAYNVAPQGETYVERLARSSRLVRATNDLAYLKKGTNWRKFERSPYHPGVFYGWHRVYPSPTA